MARKTQEELDARLGAAGGSRFVHSDTVGKRKVPNPDYDKYDKNSQETIELDIEQWRTPEGHVIQAVHMPDGSWDVIQDEPPAKPASASSTTVPADAVPRIEGTPLPGGGFDNEAPVQVWRRPDGTVVKTGPLTGPERTKWEEARQKSRNPGQKTDAQLAADDKEIVSVGYTGTGKNRKKVTTYKGGRTLTEDAPTNATATAVSYETDGTKVTKYDDGTETREQLSPQQRRAEDEARRATRITKPVQGRAGYNEVTEKDPTTGVTRTFYTGPDGRETATLPPEGLRELPPGMPELDTSTPDTARASYLAQVKWAQEQVRAGRMTRQEAVELTTPSHQAAETVISGAQQSIENARATRGQDITQEGNRLNTATSQYANAERATNDVWKVAPRGGTQAGDVLLGSILMQQLLNRQTQGSAGPVAAPGVATTPPLTAPAAAITGPNAIGAGAVPGAITPTGVASIDAVAQAASAPSEIPMTPERVQGIMQNPVFRPSPEAVMPAAVPDPEAVSVDQMPASIRRAYGRTIIDGILQQYGVAS